MAATASKYGPEHAQSALCKTLVDGRPFPCPLGLFPDPTLQEFCPALLDSVSWGTRMTQRASHADNSTLCLGSLCLQHNEEASPVQAVLKPLDVQQTKDLETTVAGLRADKMKEKTAADAAKKGERLRQRCSQGLPSGALHVTPTCAGSAPTSEGLAEAVHRRHVYPSPGPGGCVRPFRAEVR